MNASPFLAYDVVALVVAIVASASPLSKLPRYGGAAASNSSFFLPPSSSVPPPPFPLHTLFLPHRNTSTYGSDKLSKGVQDPKRQFLVERTIGLNEFEKKKVMTRVLSCKNYNGYLISADRVWWQSISTKEKRTHIARHNKICRLTYTFIVRLVLETNWRQNHI